MNKKHALRYNMLKKANYQSMRFHHHSVRLSFLHHFKYLSMLIYIFYIYIQSIYLSNLFINHLINHLYSFN